MKRIMTAITIAMTALVFSTTADARHGGQGYIEKARVILADPIYETVEVVQPVRECWNERVTRHRRTFGSYAGPITGGVIGGVLGNGLGNGKKSKRALTVAGTLLGASIGHNLGSGHRRTPAYETVRHCETVDHYEEQEQVVGYRVKYRYEGQVYTTRTTEHPGKFIRVRVDVHPIDEI